MFVVNKRKETINKTVRMSYELIEKLEQVAAEKGVSFNSLVVQCCEFALANLQDEKQEKE